MRDRAEARARQMAGLDPGAAADAQRRAVAEMRGHQFGQLGLGQRGRMRVRYSFGGGPSRWGWLTCNGNTLAAFSSHCGSNTSLTSIWIARSAGSYWWSSGRAFRCRRHVRRSGSRHLDAKPQDIGAKGLGLFQIAGLVGVEQDQRVHIAVTGGANAPATSSPCWRDNSPIIFSV